MDVVKTRLQVSQKAGGTGYAYDKGMLDVYRHVVRTEGFRALFRGILPRTLIVSPLFAITVLVYEIQQRWVENRRTNA